MQLKWQGNKFEKTSDFVSILLVDRESITHASIPSFPLQGVHHTHVKLILKQVFAYITHP